MVFVHALVPRIRQQQDIGMQQQAAVFKDRKIMLLAFTRHHGEDGQRQHADYERGLDRVAFFSLSSTLSGF